jgi:membrane protein
MAHAKTDVGRGEHIAVRAFNKFNNDWTMNLVAMVSYNALTSFFPLALALLTLLAFIPSVAGSSQHVAAQFNLILPSDIRTQIDIANLITQINRRSGLLSVISIVGLLWGGTNLFGSIESAFAIVFRVKTRDIIPQKLMCVLMIFLFTVLVPISFISTFLMSAATTTLGRILPQYMQGPSALVLGYVTTLVALFVLFLAIYTVVPNIPMKWRYAWRGTVVASITMTLVNSVFPWYAAHFLGSKQYGTAALATAIVTITWFWFFSLILLVGAQVNALAMGIGYWKYDLTRTLMDQRIPVRGGAPTAIDALYGANDSSVFETPLGIIRDVPQEEQERSGGASGISAPAEHTAPSDGTSRSGSAATPAPGRAGDDPTAG